MLYNGGHMAKGYIYIMTNPALLNMVKIGYSTDVEKRRKELSTTNLPYDYEIYATYETAGKLEDKKLHSLIDKLNPELRVSKNREFYIMTPDDAYELLEAIATISGSLDKLESHFTKVCGGIKPITKIKKPAINFAKCGIPVGAELVFVDDPNVTVIVESDRKVIYNNEITSLSAVAGKLRGVKAIQGSSYFTYNGKLITDIAKETQWNN